MSYLSKILFSTALILYSAQSFAGGSWGGGGGGHGGGGYHPPSQIPEMDAGMAVMGIGLLAGIVALIAERRRR